MNILTSISTWWNERSMKADDYLFHRGYDYAAGRLLESRDWINTIDLLESRAMNISSTSFDHFDKGIMEAIHDWKRMMRDRI